MIDNDDADGWWIEINNTHSSIYSTKLSGPGAEDIWRENIPQQHTSTLYDPSFELSNEDVKESEREREKEFDNTR